MSGGVVCRHSSDSVLLWLWHRSAGVAPMQPLACELPYAAGAALKKNKNQTKTKILKKILANLILLHIKMIKSFSRKCTVGFSRSYMMCDT